MRVLVTGSSGFIGSYLVDALVNEGYQVVGIDREQPDWSPPHEFVHADILEEGALEASLEGVDCIFHLAAAKDDWGISRQEYYRDNVTATEKLISAGTKKRIEMWFHYSTVGVLGPSESPSDEQSSYAPTTDYGASKAEAEQLFFELNRDRPDWQVMVLRPSAVFGPRHPPVTNVHRLVEAIMSDRFVMVGDGETHKTTSYIENLIENTLFLVDRLRPGVQVFHYVDHPVMTTDYLVDLIYELLLKEQPRWHIPLWLARPVAYMSDVAASALQVNFPITAARIEKFCTATHFSASAIRKLGFRQPVPNDEAVARTVRWHLERSHA